MMKMTGKAFAKKLFGAKYERLSRTLLIDVIIFWGLYIAGFQVQAAASVRILMVSAFTAGIMWQALSSRDSAVELKHMLMLPHQTSQAKARFLKTKWRTLWQRPRCRPHTSIFSGNRLQQP